MPNYGYRCKKCGKDFSLTMTIKEHSRAKVKCPSCKSDQVVRKFESFFAKTGKKT